MSQQQVEGVKARESGIKNRNFFITRTDPSVKRNSSVISRSSMSSRNSIGPGVIQQLSNTGITEFRGTRQKEKREMQDLNERLASYIDKVHYLDTQCKKLEAENEALRNRKMGSLEPIRAAYEDELAQARNVIDELSKTRGQSDAKLAGLQDEIAHLKELIATYENQSKDYRKKIDTLGNQIGEYEGELHTMRLRCESLEDENAKLREILDKIQEQNRGLRSDLDQETSAHIEAECMAQTKAEESQFYKDILDQVELAKPEPITIKGMDTAEYWNSQMKKCLREINLAYDEKLELIQADCEAKYAAQLNSLKAGNVKDNMQLNNAMEEVKRVRAQLADKNSSNADMNAKLASLQAERDELSRQLASMENELEALRHKYSVDVGDLQGELDAVLKQLQDLMDAKMTLELEIACYKKLLEGEENRVGLRNLVEQAMGTQGKGAASLADAIQQSRLQESTGSLTIQRSNKGPIGFLTIDHSGGNCVIENTTAGARSKTQNLKGWKLVKLVNKRPTVDVLLKDFDLAAGKSFTLWARGAKEKTTADNEQISDSFSFGMGTCVWKLYDQDGNDKATLNATFSG